MELSEFLLARIAEDEAHVDGSGVRDRIAERHPGGCWLDLGGRLCVRPLGHLGEPHRVLAECEAKRRIVEDFEILHRDYRETHSETTEARRFQARVEMMHLASVYADHPDYDESWKP